MWLKDHCNLEFSDHFKQFIFSIDNDSVAGKYMSLLLKYFIYKSKFKENAQFCLTLNNFNTYTKEKLHIRKSICAKNNKMKNFENHFVYILSKL